MTKPRISDTNSDAEQLYLAALLAAGLVSGVSVAIASDDPDPRAGIEKAKKAGMKVDPAVEPLMEQAPIGTCGNDPTLAHCPPARAAVKVDVQPDGTYMLAPSASSGRARMAAAPYCALRVNGPYYAAGYAQGDATNECYQSISRHELDGELLKFYVDRCYQMTTRFSYRNDRRKIEVHPRYACTAYPERYWRMRGTAYVLHGGTWYAASATYQSQFNCG